MVWEITFDEVEFILHKQIALDVGLGTLEQARHLQVLIRLGL